MDRKLVKYLLIVISITIHWAVIYSKPNNARKYAHLKENSYINRTLNNGMKNLCTRESFDESSEVESEEEGLSKPTCGLRNKYGVLDLRIGGGEHNTAQYGEFPWMIMILIDSTKKGVSESKYKCGGSLIHPKVVLTAAHCIIGENLKVLKVRGGEWNTQTEGEVILHQDRKVEEVIIHEDFNSGTGYNDLALLILSNAFAKRTTLGIICLPHQDDTILSEDCYASGWGKDFAGKFQMILKKVQLPIIPRDRCQESLQGHFNTTEYKLDASFICAGGKEGYDTCIGDGGSPLVCPVKDKKMQYQQGGIVSWGVGCGTKLPGIYVNVAKFKTWIDKQLERYGIQSWYNY